MSNKALHRDAVNRARERNRSAHNEHELPARYQEEIAMIRIWMPEMACLFTRLVGLFLLYGILNFVPVVSLYAGTEALQPQLNVGYKVLDVKYTKDDKARTLAVAVWYPTAAQPKPHNYGGPTSGNIALDAAPLADGDVYPFLVFSHGYGGSGLGAVFFAEALAARGWIVACPDHHDKHSAVRIRTGQQKDFG
jgi:hypothetical protein